MKVVGSKSQAPGSGESHKTLYLVSLNHLVNDGSVYLLSSLFPVAVVVLGFTGLQLGVIVAVGYLISVVFQPLVGRYSEGRRPRDMLAVGILVVAAGAFSFVFASDFAAILLAVVILRLGSSFYHPVGVSAVSATYGGPQLDGAMGFQSAFGNLGILLVFLVSAPLYVAFGWKVVFVIFSLLGILVVAVTLSFFGSEGRGLRGVPKATHGLSKGPLGVPAFFLATMFLSGGAYAVVLNFANVFLQRGGEGVVSADAMVAAWIASAFVGAILVGRLTSKMERGLLLSSAYFVSAATVLLVATAFRDPALEVLALAVNGFALSATYPITYSALSDYLSERSAERGSSFGVIFSAQTVGGAVLGLLAGYFSGAFGFFDVFLILAGLLVLGGALALSWSAAGRWRGLENQPLRPA